MRLLEHILLVEKSLREGACTDWSYLSFWEFDVFCFLLLVFHWSGAQMSDSVFIQEVLWMMLMNSSLTFPNPRREIVDFFNKKQTCASWPNRVSDRESSYQLILTSATSWEEFSACSLNHYKKILLLGGKTQSNEGWISSFAECTAETRGNRDVDVLLFICLIPPSMGGAPGCVGTCSCSITHCQRERERVCVWTCRAVQQLQS